MSARKIAIWHEAGLIDAGTRDRLLAYETDHARPLALWAVFGIGALAIGLGLVSVIAANWEAIPGQLRLGVHLALIAGALAALFLREERLAETSPWAVEALVFVTAALGLTFFGHLGQVYQTSSPLWQPLAVWLALFAPLLLLSGRSWPSALVLLGGAVWCAWDYTVATTGYGGMRDPALGWLVWTGVVTALPVLLAPLAAGLRARSTRPDFWRRLEQLALAYAVAGASLACALASAGGFGNSGMTKEWASLATSGAVVLIAGLGVVLARLGVGTIEQLKKWRGYFIVGAFVVAAVITPPDVVSQLALAIPMCILYEIGIVAAQIFIKHTKAPDSESSKAG